MRALPESFRSTPAGREYTDPDHFSLEQERIFEQTWSAVARSTDLSEPGAFQTATVGRESVLIVRGNDGVLRAFLNVCRHRGALLCAEPRGQVTRKFQCPYHSWTYALDGRLIAAPNLASMHDVDRDEFGLVGVHLREWLGYVWVCLAPTPPSFEDDVLGAVADRLGGAAVIDRWQIGSLHLGHRISYDVAANWKLIIENFLECYHCATIHPELTDVIPEFADGLAAQYFVGHGASFGADVDAFTVDGSVGGAPIPDLPEEHDRRYYAVTVAPQVFINLVPDHVIFHRMTPLSADRTRVDCDWLYTQETLDSGFDLTKSVELFHRVNEQDFDACERCQVGMSSRNYRQGGVLVPGEHHIQEFHRWVSERLRRD
ncbi:MAG TPA: aromatic ring-hydroxylating dioxygenase subunit alpha [Actinomycetes bacterium]|nr:aromatic ring-hydroxylating dioxygenase subunit alpha [Actinomycetes bacterium]